MSYQDIIREISDKEGIIPLKVISNNRDEVYIDASQEDFNKLCLWLHKRLKSPVMMFFATDERRESKAFILYCLFIGIDQRKWFFVRSNIPQEHPCFNSLAREIYSAHFFEREIKEMFGIEPVGNPDTRRLNLHDEVWPEGHYPLKKDFKTPINPDPKGVDYRFKRIEGEGIFEIPVGPVHAGIIGPGHFRFSVAGEPIISLEIRLGFTHRGIEKAFEGKGILDAVNLAECVSGDAAFSHGLAFCQGAENILGIDIPVQAAYLRGIFLELERMYNHVADIGGMATDVGFSYPAMYAAIIKEQILLLNQSLTGSRYLKGVNIVGGLKKSLNDSGIKILLDSLKILLKDFKKLEEMLYSSVSFMDRVDDTGILKKKTAEDFGVVGLAARACGIAMDLRKVFPCVYSAINFNQAKQQKGDVLSRLNVRIFEFMDSAELIKQFASKLNQKEAVCAGNPQVREGLGLGFIESWRGPVLYWIKSDKAGLIERCKIVDASFHNWQGLAYAVLGNIVPDFPLCNKSFNLSYCANDL